MAAVPHEQRRQSGGAAAEAAVPDLVPLLIGVVRLPPPPNGAAGPLEADRIVLLNPAAQAMVVLRSERSHDDTVFSNLLHEMMALEMQSSAAEGTPPASKEAIDAMRTVDFVKEGEECAVCLDGLSQEAVAVKEMPCGHRYHQGCIEKWLGMHGSCPVCRHAMPAKEEGLAKKGGNGGGGRGEERGRGGEMWFSFVMTSRGAEAATTMFRELLRRQQQGDDD